MYFIVHGIQTLLIVGTKRLKLSYKSTHEINNKPVSERIELIPYGSLGEGKYSIYLLDTDGLCGMKEGVQF